MMLCKSCGSEDTMEPKTVQTSGPKQEETKQRTILRCSFCGAEEPARGSARDGR